MIDVVLGGQFGSEGKGEFVAYLSEHYRDAGNGLAVVRTGGPNAGHTVTRPDGERIKMRMVPAGWVNRDAHLYLAAGGLINLAVLEDELTHLRTTFDWQGKFYVDYLSTIIERKHERDERDRGMRKSIGSTTEGIGAARADKIMRTATTAKDNVNWLPDGVEVVDVAEELNDFVDDDEDNVVVIESTQGFGLSLELSGHYPFATSANITPGHLLGECGLSPSLDSRIIAVMRTFPIRVAGNSGPMFHELTWEDMHSITKGRTPLDGERTTVTNLTRRIGVWDSALAGRMSMVCRPDAIALTFLDYQFPKYADCNDARTLLADDEVVEYLNAISVDCNAPVMWISTGPGVVVDVSDRPMEV